MSDTISNDARAALRDERHQASTRKLWRSLEQLSDDAQFRQFLEAEFPAAVTSVFDSVGRRQFLQLMGASLALAGMTACTHQPEERIVPNVRAPENVIPGEALYYASAVALGGDAIGVLVESHMGRPTKIEGNPDHPGSLGATDAVTQAAILTLYDPERSRVVRNVGEIRPWSAFFDNARQVMSEQQARGGSGLRLLTGTVTSPTLAARIRALVTKYPQAKWHQWEPVNDDNLLLGSRQAFGADLLPNFRLAKANIIVSLDSDFLSEAPQHLRLAREFTARRKSETGSFNRLYAAEASPSLTGVMADHRLAIASSSIARIAAALAQRVGVASSPAEASTEEAAWLDSAARDLQANRGTSLVMAGPGQPPQVHALVAAINQKLGNLGETVVYVRPAAEQPEVQLDSLRQLVEDMSAGKVDALLVLGTNPVLTAPAELDFATAFQKVAYRAHLSLYSDETSHLCHWHLPEAHFLESWGDVRAADGTVSIVQPLILPLYEGKSPLEVLAALDQPVGESGHDIVRNHWRAERGGADDAGFERSWRRWLHDGIVPDTIFAPVTASASGASATISEPPPSGGTDSFEIDFRPDPHVYDGRFCNNAWLQELPKPLSKLTWDNALLIAPEAAARLDLDNGDVVEVESNGRKLQAAIWKQPGQAKGTVTLHLGYGRRNGGEVGRGRGFDAYRLRGATTAWFATGARLRPIGEHYSLVSTQDHGSMEGRDLVRVKNINAPEHGNGHGGHGGGHGGHEGEYESLYPPFEYQGNAWGMAIDLSSCIGCNACTIACQAENNIAVVGKDQVAMGREMHWIRVDRYFEGESESPDIYFQPVPCMHCENAPCEIVCPANATMHSNEGLNEMVYNRCVGTRYCANNCPYKVRRFNFKLYSDWETESLKLQRNPDVTVRSRGVMEKCTYCVQRINAVRIQAKKESRPIADGEIVPACQQVCPTDTIVFGNVADPNSRVSKLKREQRNYGLLTELNTRPRTTYLANLRNPSGAEPAHADRHAANPSREPEGEV